MTCGLSVDPRYGTIGDFVESPMREAARHRGDRPGDQSHLDHSWFKEARRDPIRNTATGTSGRRRSPRTPIPEWSSPACRNRPGYDEDAGLVLPPSTISSDLNTSHPEVQAEILKIMGFWIQLGVSGFRMDAAPFIISTKGPMREPESIRHAPHVPRIPAVAAGRPHRAGQANVLPETDMEHFGDDATACT
jgi:maltose alpha-D-glucosyltransferase/alpha-amylase